MEPSGGPSSAWHLVDVLEQLPRDVLQDSFWQHLLPLHHSWPAPSMVSGHAFRLSCLRTRALADQITHGLHLEQKGNTAPDLAVQARHGTLLSRQEALKLLDLKDSRWDSNPAIPSAAATGGAGCESHIVTTLQLGGAACRRLQTLCLTSYSGCTAAAGHAVKAACPVLGELVLRVEEMVPAFLEPWHSYCHLTKLSLFSCSNDMDVLLLSAPLASQLASLHGLRSLDFGGELTSVEHLNALWHLTSLHELRLDAAYFPEARMANALRLGQALGSLTQLTALQLPTWTDPPSAVVLGQDRSEIQDVVLRQLSSLRQLRALSLNAGSNADVLQGGFGILRGLPLLTHLSCSCVSPTVVNSGPPPRLQRLEISCYLSCEMLVATLRPLLPLAHLQSASFSVNVGVDAGCTAAANGAIALAALAAAAWAGKGVAEAPALQRVSLGVCGPSSRAVLPAAPLPGLLPALLLPLQQSLTTLNLADLPLAAMHVTWPALQLATRLESLSLEHCKVEAQAVLLLVGQHLPALQRLSVFECSELPCPVAVAQVRGHVLPLHVSWVPRPSMAQRNEFMAAARVGVTISW